MAGFTVNLSPRDAAQMIERYVLSEGIILISNEKHRMFFIGNQ